MRMLEACAGLHAMILEDDNVAKALVTLEIQYAVAIGPQHLFDLERFKVPQTGVMLGRLDYHFVRPDPIHQIVYAVAAPSRAAFNPQCRKLVGDAAHAPSGLIGRRAGRTIRQNFGRGQMLHSGAEYARSTLALLRTLDKVRGTPTPLRGHNHPPADDRVFSQFGHFSSYHSKLYRTELRNTRARTLVVNNQCPGTVDCCGNTN